MKIGDLVKEYRQRESLYSREKIPMRFGIILEVWLDDDHWGDTAVVEWSDGFREEITSDNLEVICK